MLYVVNSLFLFPCFFSFFVVSFIDTDFSVFLLRKALDLSYLIVPSVSYSINSGAKLVAFLFAVC